MWLPDEKEAWLHGEVLAINGADLLVSVAKVGCSTSLLLGWRVCVEPLVIPAIGIATNIR